MVVDFKSKSVRTVKLPSESVWFGMEPLLILNQILGFWPRVSFRKPDPDAISLQQKPSYFSSSGLRMKTIYSIVVVTQAFGMGVVNIIGESTNELKDSAIEKFSYLIHYVYPVINVLPMLISMAVTPKLVKFFNNIADLDSQLRIQPEDCLAIRRRSWVFTISICTLIATNIGLCCYANFEFWRKAGGSAVTGYLGVILTPTYMFYSVTVILFLVQLMNILRHRFQLLTAEAVKVLKTVGNNDKLKCRMERIERKPHQTLVERLNEIRQHHELLQDNVELFHDLSASLIGCIIPLQIFLIITQSFALVRDQNSLILQGRAPYMFTVAIRITIYIVDLIMIFWSADELKYHMMTISRAIQKHKFFGLQPDEQIQIQLLSSISSRCRVEMNPAGYFSLTRAIIPAFQTYKAGDAITYHHCNVTGT